MLAKLYLTVGILTIFCFANGQLFFENRDSIPKKYKWDLGAFQFWLFGIAQKVAADHFRKRKNEIPLDAVNPRSNQKIEKEIESKADAERLASILKILSERERSLISLKYGADLNNREIARQTGLSESNVGTILFRAVTKLRKEWEKTDGR